MPSATLPHASGFVKPLQTPTLPAPPDLVAQFVALQGARRRLEADLAYVRAELELAAASMLREDQPRGRFVAPEGGVTARLLPTCTFDRAEVARALERAGRLSEVALLNGATLARFLAREPALAARLGALVRLRQAVVLTVDAP